MYGSILTNLNEIDKIICLFFAILGIIDTLKIKEKRNINKIEYKFYENYFIVHNTEIGMEISYELIERIKNKKDCYIFIVLKTPMVIGKEFKGITDQELKKFIKEKTNINI